MVLSAYVPFQKFGKIYDLFNYSLSHILLCVGRSAVCSFVCSVRQSVRGSLCPSFYFITLFFTLFYLFTYYLLI